MAMEVIPGADVGVGVAVTAMHPLSTAFRTLLQHRVDMVAPWLPHTHTKQPPPHVVTLLHSAPPLAVVDTHTVTNMDSELPVTNMDSELPLLTHLTAFIMVSLCVTTRRRESNKSTT